MKRRFILYRRGEIFYSEDTTTGKQQSLRTKVENETTHGSVEAELVFLDRCDYAPIYRQGTKDCY